MKTFSGFSHIWVGDTRGPYRGPVLKHFVFFLTYGWVKNGDRMETLLKKLYDIPTHMNEYGGRELSTTSPLTHPSTL